MEIRKGGQLERWPPAPRLRPLHPPRPPTPGPSTHPSFRQKRGVGGPGPRACSPLCIQTPTTGLATPTTGLAFIFSLCTKLIAGGVKRASGFLIIFQSLWFLVLITFLICTFGGHLGCELQSALFSSAPFPPSGFFLPSVDLKYLP